MLWGLTSVTKLFLSGNDICTISSSLLTNLKQLRVLDLSDNKLQKMEAGLLSFSSALETINLSGNKLSEIPPNTIINYWSRNTVRMINQNTFYNLYLAYVDFSHNEIEFVQPDAFNHIARMPSLSTCTLNNSRILQVPSRLFYNITLLENVLQRCVDADPSAERPRTDADTPHWIRKLHVRDECQWSCHFRISSQS